MPFKNWNPSSALQTLGVTTAREPFVTEAGDRLPDVTLAYETWGRLNRQRDNVVLVVHALTGDAHAASHPDVPNDPVGWWEDLIGPGAPIDTNRWFVICVNALGSCYGSTGPCSIAPDGERYNLRFPSLTVRDLVNAQLRLLDRLHIDRLACVIGGSLGGMEALEFAVMAPDRVRQVIPIAASGQFHAQGIAYNEIQRRAIMLDPRWNGGDYRDDEAPDQGIALARMLGMVTYQSDSGMSARFAREPASYAQWPEFQDRYDVEGYLHYQGDKLADRYDANTYLYLSRVMDSHDIGRGRGGVRQAVGRIRASARFIGISTDILFPPSYVRRTSEVIKRAGGDSEYWELDSIDGHDAFLKNFEQVGHVLRSWINGLQSERSVRGTYPIASRTR